MMDDVIAGVEVWGQVAVLALQKGAAVLAMRGLPSRHDCHAGHSRWRQVSSHAFPFSRIGRQPK
jgi:hypothetical protein